MTSFDYIIIGAGSAGSTLAGRLTKDPNISVCLLEAGGKTDSLIVRVPALVVAAVHGGRLTNLNWGFESVPQAGLNGRKSYQPRGKGLGGSSAINAMIYIRGNPKDYDNWRDKFGCTGWGWDDVLPFFKRSECNQLGADDLHSDRGPLQVRNLETPYPINEDFIAACGEHQIKRNDDFNGPEQSGAGHYQVTHFHDGKSKGRCSAAAAYLRPHLDRPNLQIYTQAHVTRILFEGKQAIGVEFRKNRKLHTVKANHEIAVCAGTFKTPQLLMASGIGPVKTLKAHGIKIVAQNEAIGQNLHDHPDMVLTYKVSDKNVMGISLDGARRALTQIRQYRQNGSGFWASNIAESGAFFSVNAPRDWPDAQLHLGVAGIEDHGRKLLLGHKLSLHACILRPYSRGSVTLANAETTHAPIIDLNLLSDERDMQNLLAATFKAREIMSSIPMGGKVIADLKTEGITDHQDMIDLIRNSADTVYHPVGTCQMGGDPHSAVDPYLKVRGVNGLRVVDASIMPQIISGNTNAPTIMIAEKAADIIKKSIKEKNYETV